MTPEEFEKNAISILGNDEGWQSAIARKLGINDRTVRKWLSHKDIPDWIEVEFRILFGDSEIGQWPRDEWAICKSYSHNDDGQFREYISHFKYPRFIARFVKRHNLSLKEVHPISVEPQIIANGVIFEHNGLVLCEISWIDLPRSDEASIWLETACNEIDKIYRE